MRNRPGTYSFRAGAAMLLALAVVFISGAAALAASPQAGSSIVNTATLAYKDANGNPLAAETAQVSVPVSGAPVLLISITESSDPVAMGETLTYTISYQNTGNAQASDTSITFTLSDYVTYQSASGGGSFAAGPGGGTVTWNIGTLGAVSGGSVTVTVTVKTQSDYAPGDPNTIANGSVINSSAAITSAETGATDQETTRVGQAPNLELTISGAPASVIPGGAIVYTIHYRNIGNLAATGVSVMDILPSGTAYVAGSAGIGGVLNSRTLTWVLGTVGSGEEGDLTFQVTVSTLASSGSLVMNHASIISRELSPVTSNIVVTHVRTPTLTVSKTAPTPRAGEDVTYTIRVFNGGYIAVNNITVTDPLPAGTSYIGSTGGGIYNGSSVTWNVTSLDIGEEENFSVTVRLSSSLPAGSTVTNTLLVSADGSADQSTSFTFQVADRTPGKVEFYNSNWVRTRSYSTGDTICMQVTDADQDEAPDATDTVAVVLSHVLSGDVEHITLNETGNSTGVFRGCIASESDPAVNDDNDISVTIDSLLAVSYTDPLDAVPTSEDIALIDPFGVVFNSTTGERIQGAVVTLIDTGTGLPAAIDRLPFDPNPANTTGTDGFFAFRFVAPGSYYFDIALPAGYTYPSIVPDDQLPAGFSIGTGSRREVFTLTAGDEPLNLDVPVDPPVVEVLTVTKTADRDVVYLGDITRYTITVTNAGSIPVNGVTLTDRLPHGIQYVPGTTEINNTAAADPQGSPGMTLAWSLNSINTGATVRVSFTAIVGVDANRGDGRNTAYADGTAGQKTVTSNTAYHTMRIKEGVFTTDGIIVGKVYHDIDRDGEQDKTEEGVPGAVLHLEDGTRVTADDYGKFVIYGVRPGTHVLKINADSLPCGLVPAGGSNRFMGSDDSQFVDIVPGGMFSAEFPVQDTRKYICDKAAYSVSNVEVEETVSAPPLEERISDMDSTVDILSPSDGETVSASNTNIVVKGPSGGEFRLRVNDTLISSKRIGRRIVETEKNISIYEYVSVALSAGAENSIELEVVNPGGSPAGSAAVKVTASGAPADIVPEPDRLELQADGESVGKLMLKVVDENGAEIGYSGIITVTSTLGEILDTDIDPSADGVQVMYSGGKAEVELRAGMETGPGNITALFENVEKSIPVLFVPSFREEIVLGVGEFLIGRGKQGGDAHYIDDYRRFDRAWYSNARGAFFMKKRMWGDVLITSSYDSGKRKQYELNNERYTDYSDDDTYPLFGDDSSIYYEAKTQNKLFLKMERNKSQALIGDFETGFFDTELSAYSRTLNGFRLNLNEHKFSLGAFGARTSQVKAQDTMRGQGISGYYYLENSPIVDGSESVVVEIRDRRRPWLVLESEQKTRWTDYSIDYENGAIMFRNPVPTVTSEMDPVYIIVSYETNDAGESYYMYGARGKVSPAQWFELGFTAVTEENAAADYHQFGLDGEFRIKGIGTISTEIATTNSLFEDSGMLESRKGQAFSLKFEKKRANRYTLEAYTSKTGNDFGNIHAVDFQRGMEKSGVDVSINGADNLTWKGRFFNQKDYLNDSFHRFSSIGFRKVKRTFQWETELFRETSRDSFIPVSVSSSRYPFDNTEETPDETTALRLGISTNPTPRLKILFEHQQDIQYSDFNISTAGLEFRHSASTHSYVRQEFWRYLERSGHRTVFGLESAVGRNTSVFNEYRLENASDGARTQRVIGLKNRLKLNKDVIIDFSLENLKTIRGDERNSTPDAFAFTTGVEYLPRDNYKLTGRYEYRDATSDNSHMFETGIIAKLNTNVSWTLKQKYFENSHAGGSTGTGTSTLLGFAYRPVSSNRFNAFSRFELQRSKSTPVLSNFTPESRLFSIEGIWRPEKRTSFTLKYAGKTAISGSVRSYSNLVSGRLLYNITDRFDFGVEYRLLNSRKIGTRSTGGSVELGYRCVKNIWLSAGYAFDDFDADLTGDSYYGRGWYMKLRMKVD